MEQAKNPHSLDEGKRFLELLKGTHCPNFRCFVGGIREAVREGKYTYEELGATEVEILQLGVAHAGAATLTTSRYPLVDLAIFNTFKCDLQKAQGAGKLPEYALNVVKLERARPRAA